MSEHDGGAVKRSMNARMQALKLLGDGRPHEAKEIEAAMSWRSGRGARDLLVLVANGLATCAAAPNTVCAACGRGASRGRHGLAFTITTAGMTAIRNLA